MLKGNSQLREQLNLIDVFIKDPSTELVRATKPMRFPLTFCTLCGKNSERVSQTLQYKNGPLLMNVDKTLSRKRKKNKDWGVIVDIAVDIRYALCSRGTGRRITTTKQLLTALEELYGAEEGEIV